MSDAAPIASHLAWAKGGAASFVSIDDDAVVLRSTIPSPPGSRLEGRLASEPPAELKVKVHGSKREPDGSFTIRGRLLDAPRALRERVARLVACGDPPGASG